MASVVMNWNGRLKDRAAQDQLLGYIGEIAEISAELAGLPAEVPTISRLLAAQRAEGLPERAPIERGKRRLEGRVMVSGHLPGRDEPLMLDGLTLRGMSFRLHDPRRLYPGEDRLSFCFIDAPDRPELDGHLVEPFPSDMLIPRIAERTDWYVGNPSIHLRYLYEAWMQRLLSWVKVFFIPDLRWEDWSEMGGWDAEEPRLNIQIARRGLERATRETLESLKVTLREEAAGFGDRLAEMSRAEA